MTAQYQARLALPDRLPPLRGRWLTAFSVAWSGLFVMALASVVYGAVLDFGPGVWGWRYFGFSIEFNGRITGVAPGSQADKQGVQPGQTVVLFDGVPLAQLGDDSDAVRAVIQRPEGTVVPISIRDPAGHETVHRLERRAANTSSAAARDRIGAINTLINSVLILLAALFLFPRRREPVAAILALGFTVVGIVSTSAVASLPAQILAWALLLFGMLAFPDAQIRAQRGWWFVVALMIVAVVGASRGPDADPSLSFGGMFAIVVARVAIRARRSGEGVARQQVRWAFFGIVAGLAAYILATVILAAAWRYGRAENLWLYGSGQGIVSLGTAFIVGGLVISLLRYRLYDADAVIGRSAVLGVLTIGFLALFAGGEKVIEVLGERWFGEELGTLAAGLAAALAAVLVVPLHHRVSHWAEHRFQKALMRLKQDIPPLMDDLRETASTAAVAEAALSLGVPLVRGTHGAVMTGETALAAYNLPTAEVETWRAAHEKVGPDAVRDLFPTRIRLGGPANDDWLLVGPRPDGTPIGKDEREALSGVAGSIARALTVARARTAREDAFAAMFALIERRLRALEQRSAGRKASQPDVLTN